MITNIKQASYIRRVVGKCRVVGTTNGVFELITPGHIKFFEECRKYCDFLIVLVNGDESARRLGKGEGRPITNEEERSIVVNGLKGVDMVCIFHSSHPAQELSLIKPDIHFKDEEYQGKDIPEESVVEMVGGRVEYIHRFPWSTSEMLTRKD